MSLENLCRICSDNLNDDGIGIFSQECMEKLIGEKIERYLYFSVSMNDRLPKKVCNICLKKLDNIHKFAKMAAEMQEKFRMLLSQEEMAKKPMIKIRRLDDLIKSEADSSEPTKELEAGALSKETEDHEMSFDVAQEEVGEKMDELDVVAELTPINGLAVKQEKDAESNEAEDNAPSLLHSLLIKGKESGTDHDYPMRIKEEHEEASFIKEEPEDPEDEDIAEEIEEDRLNQIIKDELGSDTEADDEGDSDLEITEMEVKVDPMLYFSNTCQAAIDVDQDSQSQDSCELQKKKKTTPVRNLQKAPASSSSATEQGAPVMTRSQQKANPIIASLKLGKPYKCTVCTRSFITDIGLQNHLWSHLPKKKNGPGAMLHKNVDLEDSQVYSSNGVLHTAQPSENIALLKYVCPICGKKISTKGNLKVHLETHRPKGKYGCDICGRVFKTASNLYRHKDYHGGVQFPCNVCGRVYPTNSTLRAHSITHSDLRPHKCPLCSKTFKRNQDLKFHINQHTGARPYQCPYCPKAFASSGNCFSHRKRMHPMEVERDKERAAEIMG